MAFRNPIVAGEELTIPGIRSEDYEQAVSGWRIGRDGSAQFSNVQILGGIGADNLSVDDLLLDGLDLQTEIIDPMPDGIIAYGILGSGYHAGNITSATKKELFQFSTGPLRQGRMYRIMAEFSVQSGDVGGFDWGFMYTVDGTKPTVNSAIMNGSVKRSNHVLQGSSGSLECVSISTYYSAANDYPNLRIALCGWRGQGSSYAWLYQGNMQRPLIMSVVDYGKRSAAAGSLSQVSKSGGFVPVATDPEIPPVTPPPPDPDPIVNYTKTFNATWSRSYDSDNGTRTGDDTKYLYQGYVSGTHGNTRSLIGFDYNAIGDALAGATVTSGTITFKVAHTYYGAGSTIYFGTHNYTSKPSTWNGANVNERVNTKAKCVAGKTYTIALTSGQLTSFKNGNLTGLAVGPAPDNGLDGYAYLYGYGLTGAPKLTFKYSK